VRTPNTLITICKGCGKTIPVVYIDDFNSFGFRRKKELVQEYCVCCMRKLKLGRKNRLGQPMNTRNFYRKRAKRKEHIKADREHHERMKLSSPKLYAKYIESLRKKYSS
jgi:hypothetical protein